MKRETKENSRKIKLLILLIAFTSVFLVLSTYAWFSTQRDVTISNLEGVVEVAESLEISLDGENWSHEIDLSELSLDTNAYDGHNNIVPIELKPASTLGTAGGEGQKTVKMYRGTSTAERLTSVGLVTENEDAGYFAFDIFLKNSSKGTEADKLYLTEKSMVTVLQEGHRFESSRVGIDTTGLQNTVRVAIAQYSGTANVISDQEAVLNAVNAEDSTINKVAIWEPNSNFHVDYIVRHYGTLLKVPDGFTGLTSRALTRTSQIATYALKDGVSSVTDTYNYKDTATLAKQNVLQTTIQVPNDTMPTSYTMLETPGEEGTGLVEASDGTTAFTLPANTITKARIYVWLEGQDIDCVNYASYGGGIEVNIGIAKPGGSTEQTDDGYVSVNEIFDADGTDTDKLHIGDFVSYSAGTWTADEIAAIQTGEIGNLVTANNSEDLPDTNFQFGGFKAGDSRDGNATPDTVVWGVEINYDYVKDASTNTAITGWRVFDIEEDGSVILISAGNPEDYYHTWDNDGDGYVSEYILTGQVNSSWSTSEANNYQKRDWSYYVNGSQKAESATVLTKSRLDSWYSKYIVENANTLTNATFRMIYEEPYTKYRNMVENYSYYWLSEADASEVHYVYCADPNQRSVSNGGFFALGVRVLVTLTPEVKFTAEKTGTKTVTGGNMDIYGGDQTYNVWGIQ